MVIFNSYVRLPEGRIHVCDPCWQMSRTLVAVSPIILGCILDTCPSLLLVPVEFSEHSLRWLIIPQKQISF